MRISENLETFDGGARKGQQVVADEGGGWGGVGVEEGGL